jgi:DNA repair exonuclease SbcCD nuclease subunit
LANQLKKLKERSIPVFFILGEHDITRLQDIPVPYVFHDLKLATRLEENQPVRYNGITIFGFNKERKSNIESLLQKFKITERMVKEQKQVGIEGKNNKNILVLHQGLVDFNRFAGELASTDLPKGFDYYAMGHYHDHVEKRFDYLDNSLIAYPGSIDLSPSEGIKYVDKGFFLTDVSAQEVRTNWVKLERRRAQFAVDIEYKSIVDQLTTIIKKLRNYEKKPVIMLKISGKQINSKVIAAQLIKLNDFCLHYVWQPVEEEQLSLHITYDGKPADIDNELQRLAKEALKSEDLTSLAINEILPLAGRGDSSATLDLIWRLYNNTKKGMTNEEKDG